MPDVRDRAREPSKWWGLVFGCGAAVLLVSPTVEMMLVFLLVLAGVSSWRGVMIARMDVLLLGILAVLVVANVGFAASDLSRAAYAAGALMVGWLVRQRIEQSTVNDVLAPLVATSVAFSVYVLVRGNPRGSSAYLESTRAGAFDLNSNYHAYWLALAFSCSLLLAQDQALKGQVRRILPVAAAAIIASAIVALGTRGALTGVVLSGVVLLAARVIRADRLFGVLAVLLWVAAAFVSLSGQLSSLQPLERFFLRQTLDLNGRTTIWESVQESLADSPGPLGMDSYRYVLDGVGAHNIFLAVALGLGTLGLVLYGAYLLAGFAAPFLRDLGGSPQGSAMKRSAVLSACLVPIALTGVVEFALALWLGHAIASARCGRKRSLDTTGIDSQHRMARSS